MILIKWNNTLGTQRWSCGGSLQFPQGGVLAELESITVSGKTDTVYLAHDLGIRTITASSRTDISATWDRNKAKSLYRLLQANEWAVEDSLKSRRV